MGSALAGMLPYAIGLLVSPLPVAAVVVLLGGREGTRKGIIFSVTWWLVSFVAVLVLGLLAGAASRQPMAGAPGWNSAIKIILGLALLVWAAGSFIELRRGPSPMPKWLDRLGDLPPDRLAGQSARRLLTSPLGLAMLIAAALELGSHRLSPLEDLLPAAAFALAGTLTIILPLTGLLGSMKKPLTPWLLRYNDALLFVTSLVFGAALLVNGLRQLQ